MEDEKEVDDKEPDDKAGDDSLEDILIEGLEKEDVEEVDLGELDEEADKKVEEKVEEDDDKLKSLENELRDLKKAKADLNKALHQARQKGKESKDEAPLTDNQLLKILDDNNNDPKTVLEVVRYQARQAAKEMTGEAMSSADIKNKAKEADALLHGMYPSLSEETSEMRAAVDKTKSYYGLDSNPLGDFFATGIEVLNALPGLISAAEKRGAEKAGKDKADAKRKENIKDNLSVKSSKASSIKGLTDTQEETAKQLGLSAAQIKTFQKIVGKTSTVSVKE